MIQNFSRYIMLAVSCSGFLSAMVLSDSASGVQERSAEEPFTVGHAKIDDRDVIIISELSDELRALIDASEETLGEIAGIYVVGEDGPASRPLLGSVQRRGDQLLIEPRFRLNRDLRYRIMIGVAAIDLDARHVLYSLGNRTRVRIPSDSARVVDVYPTQDWVPENLLKFYIEFSLPMSRGEVYDHVRIRDAEGEVVESAFLLISEELWDPAGKRVTLLFDPGRIKRELRPNQEIGSPLRAGRRYTLEIDAEFDDAYGRPLAAGLQKEFEVRDHDTECPDPKRWRLSMPTVGTRQSLHVDFMEAIDAAMLRHVIEIVDPEGQSVDGEALIGSEELSWEFTPEAEWQEGEYQLNVSTRLEDLAGNSIQKPFEVDLTQPFTSPYPEAKATLRFRPEAGK